MQHTVATGQRFEPEAGDCIFELSQGHPWLVNALDRLGLDDGWLVRASHHEHRHGGDAPHPRRRLLTIELSLRNAEHRTVTVWLLFV